MNPKENAIKKEGDGWIEFRCPWCKTELDYEEHTTTECLYCPKCMDYAYDVETGENIGRCGIDRDIDEEDR